MSAFCDIKYVPSLELSNPFYLYIPEEFLDRPTEWYAYEVTQVLVLWFAVGFRITGS